MAHEVRRGEIWMYTFAAPDKRRPVLVLSSNALLNLQLHQVTVAEITSTLRDSPVEVEVGIDEGLKHASSINLINLQTVSRSRLGRHVGSISADKMRQVCQALNVATGC
ncbi:MAG: type II toxin-antitoxin system PemK/MazF family toxin [Myxococcales bacterium]|nr:type II toxin-antitoxin system PemK/MazF family toxin [Myxococcales bacterium]